MQKAIYAGLDRMWWRFDPNAYWPLAKPSFAEKSQVSPFNFARNGGQSVWCEGNDCALVTSQILNYVLASSAAPLVVGGTHIEDIYDKLGLHIGKLCARAALFGGFATISRMFACTAKTSDPRKMHKYIGKFCTGGLRKALFEECFLRCYDRNILGVWITLLLPIEASIVNYDSVVSILPELPMYAHECLNWDHDCIPEFLIHKLVDPSDEHRKDATELYRRTSCGIAENLMRVLGLRFCL
jgi:hypothetical protein